MTSAARDAWDTRVDRAPGPVMRLMCATLPGIRRVRSQVDPYADAWAAHTRDAVQRPGRRWIVLGDSMSQGVGASAHDAGWVGQLARRLAADGIEPTVLNLAATGARAPDVLERQLPLLERLQRDRQGAEHDVVTVLVGSNDLFGGPTARAALPDAMRDVVDRLPVGAVVATLPQPAGAATRANRHLERAAALGRVRLVDMRTEGPRTWVGRLAADWFHPNDAGYRCIADAVEPAVRAALAGEPYPPRGRRGTRARAQRG